MHTVQRAAHTEHSTSHKAEEHINFVAFVHCHCWPGEHATHRHVVHFSFHAKCVQLYIHFSSTMDRTHTHTSFGTHHWSDRQNEIIISFCFCFSFYLTDAKIQFTLTKWNSEKIDFFRHVETSKSLGRATFPTGDTQRNKKKKERIFTFYSRQIANGIGCVLYTSERILPYKKKYRLCLVPHIFPVSESRERLLHRSDRPDVSVGKA